MRDFKLRSELHGHSKDVRCLTESDFPERTIVSGSRDFTTRLWSENQDHQYMERHCLKGHSNFVCAVAFMSPDNQYPFGLLYTASYDKTIRMYAGDPPEYMHNLSEHTQAVCTLAVDNRRRMLVSGSLDATARIWAGKECKAVLSGHEQTIWSILVVPEDKDNSDCAEYKLSMPLILTGSADKTIKLWKNGNDAKTFKGHTDCIRCLTSLSPFEFLSSSNDTTIRRWNILTGECIHVFKGHENYVYSVSAHAYFDYFVTGSEDRCLKVWKTSDGACVQTMILPAQNVWSVLLLSNGDIVCATSDGVIRIFTENENRHADPETMSMYEEQISAFGSAAVADELGGYKISDLPGKEVLHQAGEKDGQTKMIRVGKNVEVHSWSEKNYKWEKIGDVLGAKGPSEGKKLYMGKEYDYVFDVDVEEGKPPLKLPYNAHEDPWPAAQKFIHDNLLPQVYLDEIVQFIRNNVQDAGSGAPVNQDFVDPFTGAGRYMPVSEVEMGNSSGHNASAGGESAQSTNGVGDPLTGSGRYMPSSTDQQSWSDRTKIDVKRPRGEHMPLSEYLLFTMTANAMLCHMVPALDVFRLALLTDFVADHFYRSISNGLELIDGFCRSIADPGCTFPVKILVCRIFANSFAHPCGRQCMQTCPSEVADLVTSHCLCTEKPALQISASACLANYSLSFAQNPNEAKKRDFATKLFVALKSVDSVGFGYFDQQCLFYLLQAVVTLLWGDDVIIGLAKSATPNVSAYVAKIKDVVTDEASKNIARSVERMFQ